MSSAMKKEAKLVNKVKRLIRKAGLPRWLHRFGPKKYEFWQHCIALIIKQECRLGYRRVSRLLNWLGHKTPSYSALAKMVKRVHWSLWQKILDMTNTRKLHIIAIDGSGLSWPLPSPYYYKRIDKPYPVEIPLKFSIAVDTRTKKILSLRLRSQKAHDIRDAKYLINKLPSKPNYVVADKAYDAEWLHQYCHDRDIGVCIPRRKGSKPRVGVTRLRYTARDYTKRRYGRREMVESVYGAIKGKFGSSVSSLSAHTRRVEMFSRAIAHNIICLVMGLFQRCRNSPMKRECFEKFRLCLDCL